MKGSAYYIDRVIQKCVRKNINDNENEFEYWNRHWEKSISYYKAHHIPKEIESDWWKNLYDEMANCYVDILGTEVKNLNMCELGCGSGYLSLLMAQKGANVTLIDFSPKSKEYCDYIKDYLKLENSRVEFKIGDAFSEHLDLSHKYDVVWNCGVLEHYDDGDAVALLKSMIKHTKSNGKVMVTLPNLLSPELIYQMIKVGKGSEIYYNFRKLKDIMEQAGLINVHVHPINYWVPSYLPASWANKSRKHNVCRYFKSLAWLFNGIGTKVG